MSELPWQRVVIKVGSALIAPTRKGCSSRYLLSIAKFIVHCRLNGCQVVLVSSGSVAAGAESFKSTANAAPALKKAMAATGQMAMMAAWQRLFDFPTAQLLLTQNDLQDRERYRSIKETAFELLDNDILPVVNENDAVTTDAFKVGDNDNLAAMIASAVSADALIICSDIDGLYNKNPQLHADAEKIEQVEKIDDTVLAMAGDSNTDVGTGGMRTKLEAAEKATASGVRTYIVNGSSEQAMYDLQNGRNPGTVFLPHETPLQDGRHWMTHTSQAQGEIIVCDSTESRLLAGGKELKHTDILDVVGDFSSGDTILIRAKNGTKLAKATTQHSSCVLSLITRESSGDALLALTVDKTPIISNHHFAILETQ
ncbi:glutamate 5-kinase [Corallincola holothuriorum]|uniref:Glutamate 5-kinase n=1 Tax=Corallincola holothuriorum TaxID=2282215 RepID=A0A368N5F9_9GAMM|nr:glutamate 5-kinase [Corallincola holothuriorum]RCU45436.1 glutamate 5-kinase [Corallincola holothuriorum]